MVSFDWLTAKLYSINFQPFSCQFGVLCRITVILSHNAYRILTKLISFCVNNLLLYKMENLTPNTEIRLVVAQCFRTLTTSAENKDIITTLQTFHSYLDDGSDSRITSIERAEFRKAHFTRTVRFLVSNIQADWMHNLKVETRKELWDGLFLKGPPEQTLLVLMEGIGELRSVVSDKRHVHSIFVYLFIIISNSSSFFHCRPSINLDHLVSITERFLQNGRLAELLWSYCLETGPSDSPQLRETLQGRIVGLPDLLANRLHLNNKTLFLPQQYYPLLATEMLTALERVCQALRSEGSSISLFNI